MAAASRRWISGVMATHRLLSTVCALGSHSLLRSLDGGGIAQGAEDLQPYCPRYCNFNSLFPADFLKSGGQQPVPLSSQVTWISSKIPVTLPDPVKNTRHAARPPLKIPVTLLDKKNFGAMHGPLAVHISLQTQVAIRYVHGTRARSRPNARF